jgi:hypothetical protein
MVKGKISNKKINETEWNENAAYQNKCNEPNSVLKEKVIALHAYVTNEKRTHINNISSYLR